MPLTLYVDVEDYLERLSRGEQPPHPGGPAIGTIRLGDEDFELPERFGLTYTPTGDEPGWRMEFAVRDGVPQCRKLTVEATEDGREVQSVDLRSLRIGELLELAATNAAFRREIGNDRRVRMRRDLDDLKAGVSLGAVRRTRRAARRTIDDDALRRVAEVYRANVGDRPTEAVRLHLGVAERTARLYVRRARDAGFLGESLRGKAGES